jgi:hypothetical protein
MTGWLGFYLCRILRSKVANAQKVLEAMVLIRVLILMSAKKGQNVSVQTATVTTPGVAMIAIAQVMTSST